jgi:hypothetical protein
VVDWRGDQAPGACQFLCVKIRLDRARDAIDLIAATVDASGLVENAIFAEDLGDGRAPSRGIVFTKDIVKIAVSKVDMLWDITGSLFGILSCCAILSRENWAIHLTRKR